MTAHRPISALMSEDFRISGVHEAHLACVDLTVLVDKHGKPTGLIGPTGAAAAVVVPVDAPLSVVLSSENVLEALADRPDALVLVDSDGRPVGVVPLAKIDAALAQELRSPHELGDFELYGAGLEFRSPVRIICAVCREPNEFDRRSTSVLPNAARTTPAPAPIACMVVWRRRSRTFAKQDEPAVRSARPTSKRRHSPSR